MIRKDYYRVHDAPTPGAVVPAASAVVVDAEGRILLCRPRDDGLWSLPSGPMEPGESITQTVIREVTETTGLGVKVVNLVGIYSDPEHVVEYSDGKIGQLLSICFACKPESGATVFGDESYQVGFFSREELRIVEIHPAHMVWINDYLSESQDPFIR